MTDKLKALIDEAVLLMRHASDTLEVEGYYVTPTAMRKLCDELDKELAK